jgi:hypothetical protein
VSPDVEVKTVIREFFDQEILPLHYFAGRRGERLFHHPVDLAHLWGVFANENTVNFLHCFRMPEKCFLPRSQAGLLQ